MSYTDKDIKASYTASTTPTWNHEQWCRIYDREHGFTVSPSPFSVPEGKCPSEIEQYWRMKAPVKRIQ